MSGPVGHARYCRIRIRSRITGSWQYTATKYMQWLTSNSHVNSEKHGRKQYPSLAIMATASWRDSREMIPERVTHELCPAVAAEFKIPKTQPSNW